MSARIRLALTLEGPTSRWTDVSVDLWRDAVSDADHLAFAALAFAAFARLAWQVLKFSLSGIDHAICVSHTCRENLVLRASLDPTLVSACWRA